jgi:Ni,Fe-hydrogenase I large subunit
MEFWTLGQIVIDVILVGILVRLIISGKRHRKGLSGEHEAEFERPGELIEQMRRITAEMEGNLEEKRELTNRLLGRLDEALKRAEKQYRQLNDLFEETGEPSNRHRVPPDPPGRMHQSIRALMDKGLTAEEVARRLGTPVGEIELFLKLDNRSAGT